MPPEQSPLESSLPKHPTSPELIAFIKEEYELHNSTRKKGYYNFASFLEKRMDAPDAALTDSDDLRAALLAQINILHQMFQFDVHHYGYSGSSKVLRSQRCFCDALRLLGTLDKKPTSPKNTQAS